MPSDHLSATFSLPFQRVQTIAARNKTLSKNVFAIKISPLADGRITCAEGDALSVMTLVGAIAAEGEPALIEVTLTRPSSVAQNA